MDSVYLLQVVYNQPSVPQKMSLGFSSGMPPMPIFGNGTDHLLFTTVWRSGVDGELITKWYEGIVRQVCVCNHA